MHVLLITQSYPNSYNPVEAIFFQDQANALSSYVKKVGVISIIPISIKAVIKSRKINFGFSKNRIHNVETWLYTYLNIPKRPKYCVNKSTKKGLRLFEKYITENGKPDIIHIHRYESGILALKIMEKYQIPYVVTEHSSFFLLNTIPKSMELIANKTFKNAKKNIAVSEYFSNVLSNKYKIDFLYIPNIVDTNKFILKPEIKNQEPFVFFNVASLTKNKNHKLMIDAFGMFNKEFPNSILRIAGVGVEEINIMNQINKLGLENKVIMLGKLSREQILNELHKCHIFLLSSVFETFGVVIIEAMSTGTPVLSTRCGGAESIIKNNELGMLVHSESLEYLRAMKKMYLSFSNYDSNGIREYVVNNFSQEFVSEKLIEIYTKVLNNELD
jgi:L-malate glycosyltransferase